MSARIPRGYSEDQKWGDDIAMSCHAIATKLNFNDDAFRCIGAYVASQFDAELTALRTALLRIQTHPGFDENNCAMKSYDVLCECQRWAEEALAD